MSQLQSKCPEKPFELKDLVFQRNFFSSSTFLDIEQQNCGVLANVRRRGCLQWNPKVQKKNFRGFFSGKLSFETFSDIERKNVALWRIFFNRDVKIDFYVSWRTFWREVYFFTKSFCFLHLFWKLTEKFSGILAKVFRQSCRRCILCLQWHIVRKINCSKKTIFLSSFSSLSRFVQFSRLFANLFSATKFSV